MKHILSAIFIFTTFFSCSKKTNYIIQEETNLENPHYNNPIIGCEIIDLNNCDQIFDCYKDKLLNSPNVSFLGKIDSVYVGKILDCSVNIFNNSEYRRAEANDLLVNYYLIHIDKGKKRNPPRMLYTNINTSNIFYKILLEWNSMESFEIGIKFIEYSDINCWDHDVCENLRWQFINNVLFPKLSSTSQSRLLDYYFSKIESEGLLFVFEDTKKLEKFVDAYCKLLIQDWNDGKLKLKVEEEQESER
jgi:hypothetical protein